MDLGEKLVQWISIDWKQLDWQQLISMNEFKWTLEKTPFSHLQVPILAGVGYLISLFVLQNMMKDKKPFKFHTFTIIHNIFLTVASLSMFLGASYGAFLKYRSSGFWAGLVCEQESDPIKGPLFYWSYIFYLSKIYEMIDSYLLVLKKKPLIFLHVFHHFIMPFVCWAGLEGKWCMALWSSCFWNSFVHIFMYYYYTVSCFGHNPWWKKHLTALQIYQFVTGVVYTYFYIYYYFQNFHISFNSQTTDITKLFTIHYNAGCTGELWAIIFMFSVNNSFLVLFTKW